MIVLYPLKNLMNLASILIYILCRRFLESFRFYQCHSGLDRLVPVLFWRISHECFSNMQSLFENVLLESFLYLC